MTIFGVVALLFIGAAFIVSIMAAPPFCLADYLSDEDREEWKRDDRKAFRAAMVLSAVAAVFALADWEARAEESIPVCKPIAELREGAHSADSHVYYCAGCYFVIGNADYRAGATSLLLGCPGSAPHHEEGE